MKKKITLLIICAILFNIFATFTASAEQPIKINDINEFNSPEYKIGVNTGADSVLIAEELFANAQIIHYTTVDEAILAVQTGKADGFFFSRQTLEYAIRDIPEIDLLDENIEPVKIAVGARKDTDEKLKNNINSFIAQAKKDGTLDDMYDRWVTKGDQTMPNIPPVENPDFTLKIGTSGLVRPFNYFIENNEITGYDIEFLKRLCDYLNCDYELDDMDFPALISSLQSKKLDLVVSNLNYTEERGKVIWFSDEYLSSPNTMLVKTDRFDYINGTARTNSKEGKNNSNQNPEYNTLEEIKGKKIGVLTGGIFDEYVINVIGEAEFSYYNDSFSQVEDLINGKVEGIVLDLPFAQLIVARNSNLAIIPEILKEDTYGFAFAKGSPLTKQFQEIRERYETDGTMEEIANKWLSNDDSKKVMPDFSDDPNYDGSAGVIRVACYPYYEPSAYIISNDRVVGYEVELLERIAHELNYSVEYFPQEFSSIIPSLVTNKADIGLGNMSITDERKQSVDFVTSMSAGGAYIVVRKADSSNIEESVGFWSKLKQSFIGTFVTENRWKLILQGFGVTLLITLSSIFAGTILGFIFCLIRRSKIKILRGIMKVIVFITQGTPTVVLLMIFYYIIFGSVDVNPIIVAIIGFSINFAAYCSEMMRVGIDAVDAGQIEGAQALGFTKIQAFIKITLPQAARHFLPVFRGEAISLLKITSIVGYIAIQDLTKMSDIIRSRTYEAFFPLISTAIIYIIFAYIITHILSAITFKLDPKNEKKRNRILRKLKSAKAKEVA